MEFLYREVAAGYTVLHVVGGVAGLIVLWAIFKVVFKDKSERGGHLIPVSCDSCGWSGSVSKHHRRCPSCSGSI